MESGPWPQFYAKNVPFFSMDHCTTLKIYLNFQVTLKLDERELEHAMQDKVLISSILQEGIPK